MSSHDRVCVQDDDKTSSHSVFHLLQPDLLTENQLRRLLILRCSTLKHLHSLKKCELVELAHKVIVPLPQRQYKMNRRGKLLTKLRSKWEKRMKKQTSPEKGSNVCIGFKEIAPSRLSNAAGDRLKPPLDAVNYERKKIRLSSNESKTDDLSHIQIKRRQKEVRKSSYGDSSAHSAAREDIGSSNRTEKRKLSEESSSQEKPRQIKLIRTFPSSVEESLSDASPSVDCSSKSRKEKTKISWP